MQRTSPDRAERAKHPDDNEAGMVRLVLLDGRTIADSVALRQTEGIYGDGIDTSSVQAHRLGGDDGPILVTWTDYAQGQGHYQSEFYVVLSGGRAAAPLLRGMLDISGHSGFADWFGATLTITLKGDVLTRRIENKDSQPRTEPAPGCLPMAEEPKVFICESSSAVESRYRVRGEMIEPIAFEESLRLEPGIDLAPLLEQGWRTAVAGSAPPKAGDWLRRTLPLAEGAAKYPACGPLGVEP